MSASTCRVDTPEPPPWPMGTTLCWPRGSSPQDGTVCGQRSGPSLTTAAPHRCSPALGRQIPFSVAGIGHGDRAHAADEYFTINSVAQLMHFTVDYLGDVSDAMTGMVGAQPSD